MNEELIEIVIDDVENEQEVIEIDAQNDIEIDVSESIGWVNVDSTSHYSLYGRDDDDQHPITAISGLRRELDQIKALQVVSADKIGIANYYEWHDGAYDETGYFVSIEPGTSTVKICDGANVFGVTVASAGFVGGQDGVTLDYVNGATNTHGAPRDNSYCLVATSGVVDVRCELDVTVGNCVIPNAHGWAKKSGSNYGYKVLARENKDGVEYAVISLGVQADKMNLLGEELGEVREQVDANYNNIVSATNVANQAYNKSMEAKESSSVSEEAVKKALEAVLAAEKNVEDFERVLESTNAASAQAKAIAESAAVSATSLRDEAIARANDAWAKAESVETEARSLCAKIDQYSVGEYSQAYGLTFEQAQSILQDGMIYVPTVNHSETYEYTNNPVLWDGVSEREIDKVYYCDDPVQYYYYENDAWNDAHDMPKYQRDFVPRYLYQWGYLPAIQKFGWITIDKDYKPTDEVNDSSEAVYFSVNEPTIGADNNIGYWYTNSEIVKDRDGNTGTYEPYTLYKWEEDHWLAVATLAGNASNRMTSEIYHTTNSITLGVANPRGCIAALDVRVTDTESTVQQFSTWKKDEEEKMASVKTVAGENGSSVIISALTKNGATIEEMASLVLDVVKDGDGNPTSALSIGADYINLNGVVTANNNVTIGTDGKITARSGYIGDGENGFEIGSKSIYNKHAIITPGAGSWQAYLTSPTQINLSSLYCMTDETSEFVYIGADGIGTVKYTNLDNGSNTDAVELSSYMAGGELFSNSATITGHITATSGYIGDGTNGLTIGYSERSGTYALMYNQDAHNNTSNQNAEGVYVGSDGIGLGNGRFYINQRGDVHMRTGTIGYGDSQWHIFGQANRAGLYYGSGTLAGDGNLGLDVTDCYIGTSGMSCSNNGKGDYGTVIKSGSILTYGDSTALGTASNNRATQVWHTGVSFFHADSNKISEIDSLSSYKVGGIEIGRDKGLNISANKLVFKIQDYANDYNITLGKTLAGNGIQLSTTQTTILRTSGDLTLLPTGNFSVSTISGNLTLTSGGQLSLTTKGINFGTTNITIGDKTALTGWIKVNLFPEKASLVADAYFMHFINGILVEITLTTPKEELLTGS